MFVCIFLISLINKLPRIHSVNRVYFSFLSVSNIHICFMLGYCDDRKSFPEKMPHQTSVHLFHRCRLSILYAFYYFPVGFGYNLAFQKVCVISPYQWKEINMINTYDLAVQIT